MHILYLFINPLVINFYKSMHSHIFLNTFSPPQSKLILISLQFSFNIYLKSLRCTPHFIWLPFSCFPISINLNVFMHSNCFLIPILDTKVHPNCSSLTNSSYCLFIQHSIHYKLFKFLIGQSFYQQGMANNQERWFAQSYFFQWLSQQHDIQFNTETYSSPLVTEPQGQPPTEKVLFPITSSELDEKNIKQAAKSSDCDVLKTRRGSIIRKKNHEETERDFRDPNFNPKKQKKNRNVLSNLAHHLMKYLSNTAFLSAKIKRIIQIHQLTIDSQEFFKIYQAVEQKFRGYVTEKNLKHLWFNKIEIGCRNSIDETKLKQFCKIMRILSSYFFKGDCVSSIVFSNKLSKQSKNLHYQGLEELKKILENLADETE